MAAVSRLQSLTNKTSLQNLIHRHLLRPAATTDIASADASNISPQFQPKSILTGHFSDGKKLSVSNADEFLLNWNFPIGIGSGLPAFDLSLMELRGSRSTSSKKRPDLEEDVEDDSDDEVDFDDSDDDEPKGFDDVYGSCDDSDEDDDDYGRHGGGRSGGSRGGGAYTA
ncbi:uncharacterized protein LOC125876597 [Solanum stenotomum]|uniref:uncharacterized protein LOC125876597 n=1 Tax=Solanum stenotomum TaxID=172797 RepID=UPI0020D10CD1|nr:uncharacterized protein LOC125876597 [Solanum stenotomum]